MFKRDEVGLPSFWTLQLLGWAFFYLLVFISVFHYLGEPGTFRGNTLFVFVLFLCSLVLRPVCRRLMARGYAWLGLELRAFSCSVPLGMLAGLAVEVTTLDRRPMDYADWIMTSMQASIMLFLWCSLYFSIKVWQQSTQERERLLRAEAEARQARLSALRYQLNPHFLFNSLNAVSTLVLEGDAPAATRMLAQIGDLLRTTLDNEARPETPLSQEIAFTEQYLAIEQTRLGGRLRVHFSIAPETLDALVPAMLLQPLVENAVRHGIAPLVEGGTIRILASRQANELCLAIENSGPVAVTIPPAIANGNGIGLANTAERLKTLYGSKSRFELHSPEAGGFRVTIQIPFRAVRSANTAEFTQLEPLEKEESLARRVAG